MGVYNLNELRNPEGLKRDLAALAFVDVWGFQEAVLPLDLSEAARDGLVAGEAPVLPLPGAIRRLLPSPDWNGVFAPLNPSGPPQDGAWEGQVIASRHPIIRHALWPLESTSEKRRFALACWIDVKGKTLLVVNTDHEVRPFALGPEDRKKQVDALTKRLRGVDRESISSLIVLGDFNTTGDLLPFFGKSEKEETRMLSEAMRKIKLRQLPGLPERFSTFRWGPFRRHLDHLFFRRLRCVRWGSLREYGGSDHRPLWARFQFSASPAEAY